jgi:hypothetical protein
MDTNTPQSGREDALSDASYDQWVTHYRMREKVHCPAELRDELNDPTVECRLRSVMDLSLTLGYTGDTTFI